MTVHRWAKLKYSKVLVFTLFITKKYLDVLLTGRQNCTVGFALCLALNETPAHDIWSQLWKMQGFQ